VVAPPNPTKTRTPGFWAAFTTETNSAAQLVSRPFVRYTNSMKSTSTTSRHTELSWNPRTRRLEGTLLGVEGVHGDERRSVAYQGEMANGEIVTVHWLGFTRYDLENPVLVRVDGDDPECMREVNGQAHNWKWFARLSEVAA
jgi:hypothetical protein